MMLWQIQSTTCSKQIKPLNQLDSPGQQKTKTPASGGACSAPPDKNTSGEHWRFCPQCGHELINEKCKLRCPRCHYFMSCSDFDFAG
jgi:hypothetical protein